MRVHNVVCVTQCTRYCAAFVERVELRLKTRSFEIRLKRTATTGLMIRLVFTLVVHIASQNIRYKIRERPTILSPPPRILVYGFPRASRIRFTGKSYYILNQVFFNCSISSK